MVLAGVEPETIVSEPDALTTRPPPCANLSISPLHKKPKMQVLHLTVKIKKIK